ncbi:ATP-binding protein [Streptomyces sp. NBC_01565]|uniref:AAA family ATPase n=1 Tax=unclassified Streptomyces TaxID=2593676 RepID=UPI002256FA4F|nr:ATP-binding protein [Streptomyces sp. NBC_01565]MCX4539558.1 ATP-binding protein [Streptomyces sp. NBC_01565]
MPLTDTEWGLVTTWVRDYLLDALDPRGRLTACGFPRKFVADLPLTNIASENALTLVQAVRRGIPMQCLLLESLVNLDALSVREDGAEADGFLARLREDARVHLQSSPEDHFCATLLRNGAEVFIDRADLRKRLKEFLTDAEKTVLVVDGEPDSGRSYTYSLIRYLGQHCGFRPVRVTLSRTSTADQVVRRLTEFVADPRAVSAPYGSAQLNDHLPAVEDAVHRIVSQATTADEQFWLVLDECDKLDANSDVWDCIGQLALAIYDRTAKPGETLPRLVLLGYPMQRQLPYYVRKNVCRDTARAVGPDDLRTFFRQFFADAPAPPDGPPEPDRLVEVAVPAVLDAAQGPGDDSYMRKLCTASEEAVRVYRELGSGEDFATRLGEGLRAAVGAPPPEVPDTRRAYREAACLLTGFDPAQLRLPGESTATGAAALELVHECRTLGVQPHTRWILKEKVREEALRGLAGPEAARLVLETNQHQIPEGPGPDRTALAYLCGTPPDLERQGVDELTDTLQALLWLRQIPGTAGLPDPDDVQRRLERARLLQPLRRLVESPFCGRAEELEQLRRYVEAPAAPPQPPLLIHGMGGTGKSTLLAKFLLDSLQPPGAGARFPFPFAYVDFERPTLSVHEPITLIAEIARQIAIQYPGHRTGFEALAGECEETARAQRQEQSRVDELYQLSTTRSGVGRTAAEAFHSSARERETDLIRRIAELLVQALDRPSPDAAPPLVIVIDSFEEAQYRASPVVGRVWAIWVALQQVYPRLRFVIAGRASVNHPARAAELRTIELGDLEADAAVELLLSCGVADAEVARHLAERVGGHPLSLKLAARAAQDSASLVGLVESLPPKGPDRRHIHHQVDQMLVQGILYDRILKHIANEDVRALAQAGLALRVITPELIQEVLAGPCGVRVETPEAARHLFGQLARLDLVEPAGPEGVRHRSDLRAIMLRLSDSARTDLMRDVGKRAVDYYAAHEGLEARAEEIYQRLRLNENPRAVEERWEPGVERFLDNAGQDMPPRAAAFLTGHLGGHTPDQVLEDADQEDWERITAHEVENLLAQGFDELAATRLAERRPWTPGSPLHALLVETLARSGRRAEARTVAEEAVDRAEEAGSTDARLDLLLLSARLAEEDGDLRAAERDLMEAEDIATGLGRDFDAMGAMLHRARLAPSPEGESDIDKRLARRLRQLPDEELSRQPVLVRAVAAEVSRQDPVMLDHTLEVVGLPDTDDSVLEALARSIDHVVAREPKLRLALARILENAAGHPQPTQYAQQHAQPPPPPPAPSTLSEAVVPPSDAVGPPPATDAAPSRTRQEAIPCTGSTHTSMSGILREARNRGTLDRLARKLLELRDQSGELVSGVAAAMGAGGTGDGPPKEDRPAERNGPRAA